MIWVQAIAISILEILVTFAVLQLCGVGIAIDDIRREQIRKGAKHES